MNLRTTLLFSNKAFVAMAVCLALLAGGVAVSGSLFIAGGFIGAVAGLALLFAPNALLVMTGVFALVIGGVLEFYLSLGQANWIGSGLALMLVVASFTTRRRPGERPVAGTSWVPPLVVAYVALLCFSCLINGISMLQIAVGLRNYLPFIGVFLAVAYFASEKILHRAPDSLVAIGLLQLPFCIHQILFIAPLRAHSLAAVGGGAESIVGTFGGNPLGGGYTGEMAIFVLLAAMVAIAVQPLSRWWRVMFVLMPIFAVASVGIAETKVVFVLTPVALFLVQLEQIRASPRNLITFLLGLSVALSVVAGIYAVRFWSDSPGEVWHAFTYSFDPHFMVDPRHRGRMAALYHWWDNNVGRFDFVHALFGYGAGATLESSRVLGEGNAVRQFGLGLDAHAAAKLLWDGGLTAISVLVAIILTSAYNAHRLVHAVVTSDRRTAMLKVSRAALICFLAILPYQVSILGGAPMQFLFWFFVGYVEYCRRTPPKARA